MNVELSDEDVDFLIEVLTEHKNVYAVEMGEEDQRQIELADKLLYIFQPFNPPSGLS